MVNHSDRKILQALIQNCRYPNSSIAKIANLHRDTVSKRIQAMQESGIIKKFYITAFKNCLGILRYSELFVRGRFSEEQIKDICDIPEAAHVRSMDGYLWITLNCPTSMRADEVLQELRNILGPGQYNNLGITCNRYLERNYLNAAIAPASAKGALTKELREAKSTIPQGIAKLDEVELKIIELLGKDARQSRIQISKAAGINRETAEHKIKNLVTQGIIRYFTADIDYQQLGFMKFFIAFQADDKRSLKHFLCTIANGVSYYEFASKWDVGIEIIYSSQQEALDLIEQLYSRGLVHSHDLFVVTKEHKFESIPVNVTRMYREVLALLP